MNKYFITLAEYPDNRQYLYETYNAPRIREYCKLHDFKFIEVCVADQLILQNNSLLRRATFCFQRTDDWIICGSSIVARSVTMATVEFIREYW